MKLATRGFDFHCHIDLFPNPQEIVRSCEAEQILTFTMTTTPKAWPQNRKWTADSRYVHCALGLHPELVSERASEITLLEEYMEHAPLVGEIGLDASPKHKKSWESQVEIFTRVLRRADDLGGRVLSIHSRRAAKQVVDAIHDSSSRNRIIPILHWYSGSHSVARKAVELGCYFSVNAQMLSRESGRQLVDAIPNDRLLIETDSPFTSANGRPCRPGDAIVTAQELARLKGMPSDELHEIIRTNSSRVLSFAKI